MSCEEFTGRSGEMRLNATWLASEDLLDVGEVTVTIEKVFKHIGAEFEEGRKADVFALKFAGKEKQMILNATNRKRLVKLFDTTDTKKWVGKSITLYVDRNVRNPKGGGKTNGLRVKVQ
jgi:hypothetical protein